MYTIVPDCTVYGGELDERTLSCTGGQCTDQHYASPSSINSIGRQHGVQASTYDGQAPTPASPSSHRVGQVHGHRQSHHGYPSSGGYHIGKGSHTIGKG